MMAGIAPDASVLGIATGLVAAVSASYHCLHAQINVLSIFVFIVFVFNT